MQDATSRCRGAILIEFAICMPILIILLFYINDVVGPTDTQKKDIALSLNVASGRGYENKGARGIWERIASAALWAPRFAISGAKMAIGWNIVAPHFTGLTTERSYKDRWVSSKVAA